MEMWTPNVKLPRDRAGKLSAYAWPGGYPILYHTKDGCVLCSLCADLSDRNKDEFPGFKPVEYFIHYEGPSEFCGECGKEVPSAYGDPEAEECSKNKGESS